MPGDAYAHLLGLYLGDSRYEFTNRSADIRGICTDALDLLGIAWRPNGPWRISVNRRAAVAALDEHVGPKS